MRPRLAVVLVVVAAGLAGCLGEGRSDWAFDITQLDDARASGRTGTGIRIGILDTGVDVGHNSLDHLVDGDKTNGELVGFQDHIRDRFGVSQAYDDVGHGTHVVGIMAARGSSFGDKLLYGGVDLMGGAPDALYYVAKVCGLEGCPVNAIAAALDWMRQVGADVVSLSLGGDRPGPIVINDSIRDRIDLLIDSGTVVVASAGNSGPNNADVDAPADILGVIAVGAVDEQGRVTELSSRGQNDGVNACRSIPLGGSLGRCEPNQKPELVAPGVNVLSAWLDGTYARATGTSQAAPFVAATVALMLEDRTPPASRSDVMRVKQILADTARPVVGQQTPHDDATGYGIVQAVQAIAAYGG
jgi:subtilisin family serine protease